MFKVIFFTGNLISVTSVLPSNITVSHSTYRPYILMVLNECGIYKEMICEEKTLQKSTALFRLFSVLRRTVKILPYI